MPQQELLNFERIKYLYIMALINSLQRKADNQQTKL